jgi:hypothetical protein
VDVPTLAAVGGGVAVMLTGVGAAARYVGRPMRRLLRQNDEFREDWYGEPARAGVDPRPGVMERLKGIESELRPNSGSSLRDAVNRLESRFEDHIRSGHQPPAG